MEPSQANENCIFTPGVWGPYFSAMVPGMWLSEAGQSAAGALVRRTAFLDRAATILVCRTTDCRILSWGILDRDVNYFRLTMFWLRILPTKPSWTRLDLGGESGVHKNAMKALIVFRRGMAGTPTLMLKCSQLEWRDCCKGIAEYSFSNHQEWKKHNNKRKPGRSYGKNTLLKTAVLLLKHFRTSFFLAVFDFRLLVIHDSH